MLKKVFCAIVVTIFIFGANCHAEEMQTVKPAAVVEESEGFLSSAKNFINGLFSSDDKKSENDSFFTSLKNFISRIFSNDDKKIPDDKRADIKDFEKVSADELAETVATYVNANPDKRDALINYTFNLQLIRLVQEKKISDGFEALLLNSIPVIGGLLTDRLYDKFLAEYKQLLVDATTDKTLMKILAQQKLQGKFYYDFIKQNSWDTSDIALYNSMMRIAAIRYREVEALVEENKVRDSLDIGPLDLIDMFSYEIFWHAADRETIKQSEAAFEKIYSALWIDSKKMRQDGEIFLAAHYDTKVEESVPKYLFPYNLESCYHPSSKEDVYLKYLSNDKTERKRVYDMLGGEWTSLTDGSVCTMDVLFENDDKIGVGSKVNYIKVLDKKEPFAAFNCHDKNEYITNYFVTPAIYIDDAGNRERILLCYVDYEYLNYSGRDSGNDFSIVESLRIENIKSAKSVLVKRLQ